MMVYCSVCRSVYMAGAVRCANGKCPGSRLVPVVAPKPGEHCRCFPSCPNDSCVPSKENP